ncbi:MAG: single-stranded DNA-binding protein [Myxococcota bacterium]
MAAGFVKVTLIGNLGKDPEVRFTAGGTAVANLRVACTERAKNKEGNWEDRTEWVSLVCFGKTAENAGQYLQKGRQIYAEGRLQTREWTDKDGNKRYNTEVIAFQVLFLGQRDGGGAGAGMGGGGGRPAMAGAPGRGPANDMGGGAPDEPPPLTDDDIPF